MDPSTSAAAAMPGLALPIGGTSATETRASKIEKPAAVVGRSGNLPLALLTTGSPSKSWARIGRAARHGHRDGKNRLGYHFGQASGGRGHEPRRCLSGDGARRIPKAHITSQRHSNAPGPKSID